MPRATESRQKLLAAAIGTFREKGYAATRVEDICAAAGVTKGSFFHHFGSKEELALAAAEYWTQSTGAMFADAGFHAVADPRGRLLAYVELRKALLRGTLPEFTCFAGTLIQEVHGTHPELNQACGDSIRQHAATLAEDVAAAMGGAAGTEDFTPESLALFMQAVIQGAFILAKAQGTAEPAAACLDHLRRYLELLLPAAAPANQLEEATP